MITWDDPDRRYYQHGLDRGVLYPSNLPVGQLQATNYVFNPRAQVNTNLWSTYGTNTTLARVADGTKWAFQIGKSLAGSQIGMRTATATGMGSRPTGTQVTISAEIKNPVGQVGTQFQIIPRDDTNNDSVIMTTVTSGSLLTTVPADGQWHRIYVTGIIKAARNLEGIYISKNVTATLADLFQVRNVQVNDGALVPFFDGDSPDDLNYYDWTGTPYASTSTSRLITNRAFPWNGLVSVDEGGEGGSEILYRDGQIYLADVEPSDFLMSLQTIMYPDLFAECLGIPKVVDGFYVDNQKPKRFSMSYRSLVGSGTRGDMFGYQLHLVYNAMASIGQRKRNTIGSDTAPVEFNFDLACTPVKLAGFRPSAHYIIDTRFLDPATLATIEGILYGTDTTVGRMPTPTELFDLMNFGATMKFTVHTDGTYTVVGAGDNLEEIDEISFNQKNVNGTDNGDGTYTISDGGSTLVIIET
jgi:hypothetical protein